MAGDWSPAYEDRVGRRALRLADLRDESTLRERLRHLLHHNNALLVAFGESPEDESKLCQAILEVAPKILPYATDVPGLLAQAQAEGKRILFEGAQGAMLDLASGTYPYVTSSHTLASQAALGSGAPLASLGTVLGIAKALRYNGLGQGPFPTEDTGKAWAAARCAWSRVWYRDGQTATLWLAGCCRLAPCGGGIGSGGNCPDQAGCA